MATKKYDDLTKDELVRLLEARDRRDLTRLGLVWEANEIDRDKAINKDFVTLELNRRYASGGGGGGPWRNLLIEGDNFDALRYLRMTFAGRVKCILIDPPYNTGEKDFIYNDRFVEKDHLWRHSMWLEFMFQRLTLARDLLREDGVLFVHIGEEEAHRLGCLLDVVFPGRKVGTFVWRTRSGANDAKQYFRSIDHEYVLCYANPAFSFAGNTKDISSYTNPDNDPRGPWINDNLVKAHNYKQRANTFYPLHNPETDVWYACDPDNVWRFASEKKIDSQQKQKLRKATMEQVVRNKKVLWPNDSRSIRYDTLEQLRNAVLEGSAPHNLRTGTTPEEKAFWEEELKFWVGKTIGIGKPRYKRHLAEVRRAEKPISTWLMPASLKKKEIAELDLDGVEVIRVGHTSEGTSLLQQMLGNKDFAYPKPLSLVQGLLKQVTEDDDITMDFFAGSGTTAHAILALNSEDDGDRRFVLVSSTEATEKERDKNVCRDICQRRLDRAINGYSYVTKAGRQDVPGLGGDFAYFTCRRTAPGRLMEVDHSQVWTALQLIHCDTLSEFQDAEVLHAGDEEHSLVYVPRFRSTSAATLRNVVHDKRSVIVYSWQPELVRQQLRDEVHVQVEAVPESLARRFGMKV